MTSDSTPAKPGGMLSLYANLLDPSADNSPGTISRPPVVFKQAEGEAQSEEAAAKKQVNNGMSCLLMLSMLAQIALTVH
jgi:splicing factor 45